MVSYRKGSRNYAWRFQSYPRTDKLYALSIEARAESPRPFLLSLHIIISVSACWQCMQVSFPTDNEF